MGTRGIFNYLAPSVSSSLYRNGAVLTRRNADGSDDGLEGVVLAEETMSIENGREGAGVARPTLERNGFELATRPLGDGGLDFLEHRPVVERYYPDCCDAVRAATGAREVFAFDHNVRSAAGKEDARRIGGGQEVQGPAHVVHGDYTLTSAPQRLRDLASPPSGNDTYAYTLGEGETLLDTERVEAAIAGAARYSIINVWRNIRPEPVATHPLALCDAQSVAPDDLVVFEIHYADRVGENYFAKHAGGHRWVYFPELTRDEIILIKQWDSAGAMARSQGAESDARDSETSTFSFHSAFVDPATPPDAPQRWSTEVRCVALYD